MHSLAATVHIAGAALTLGGGLWLWLERTRDRIPLIDPQDSLRTIGVIVIMLVLCGVVLLPFTADVKPREMEHAMIPMFAWGVVGSLAVAFAALRRLSWWVARGSLRWIDDTHLEVTLGDETHEIDLHESTVRLSARHGGRHHTIQVHLEARDTCIALHFLAGEMWHPANTIAVKEGSSEGLMLGFGSRYFLAKIYPFASFARRAS
ncbi:MAG: hypothetical protein IPO88_29955 [Nannocystis sp.]|uniref:hypothetical protein n=1 Tax=Nannocystis sp. TaxID=1962667 RepID=UPI002421F998|nr:hypothetical protein [Nannocystis sp.]MBK9757658.1 hypothetical protein [Nannocystis sp.]